MSSAVSFTPICLGGNNAATSPADRPVIPYGPRPLAPVCPSCEISMRVGSTLTIRGIATHKARYYYCPQCRASQKRVG